MKKIFYIAVVLLFFSIVLIQPFNEKSYAEASIVTFADPNLESVVRSAINKPTGDVTTSDVTTITSLDASNKNISDISGIESLVNLKGLYLENNNINNIDHLMNLTSLESLELDKNQITNINSLKGLVNLQFLVLDDNDIVDITPLSSLNSLKTLRIKDNQINDVSVLKSLKVLTSVDMQNNEVNDISSVSDLSSLEGLDLMGNPISNLNPLANLSNLAYLDFSNDDIVDLNPLSNLTSLKNLYIVGGQMNNLQFLQNLTQISNLTIKNCKLQDISSIEGLTNLTWLELSGDSISNIIYLNDLYKLSTLELASNNISDVSPLINLTSLTYLGLGSNDISDIHIISNLTKLTTLNLNNNHITDISALSTLNSIKYINLYNNKIVEISPLRNLTTLIGLDLHSNNISDISSLNNLSNMKYLELDHNGIIDINPLSNFTSLIQLLLGENPITDYSPIENIYDKLTAKDFTLKPITFADPNLEAAVRQAIRRPTGTVYDCDVQGITSFDASNEDISSISGIENFKNLQQLNLNGNKISDISLLANLTHLQALLLDSNQISDISALRNLTGLIGLSLHNNKMTDISALSNFTNLQSLDLSYNQLVDISSLRNLTNLDELVLNNNQIENISGLSNLKKINTLALDSNHITDIGSLNDFPCLWTLCLGDNNISDISPIKNLKPTDLFLLPNPIQDFSPAKGFYNDLLNKDFTLNTVSSIEISGSDKITITTSGNTTAKYISIVKDTGNVTLSCETVSWAVYNTDINPVSMLTIDSSGLLTINSSVAPGSYVIKAVDGNISNTFNVKLSRASSVATNINIRGTNLITIPSNGSITSTYAASVEDQYDTAMSDQVVTWSLVSLVTGVSINSSSGVVIVNNTAKAGIITIKAVVEGVSNTFTITLQTSPRSIKASPTSVTLVRGETTALPTVTGTFKDGSTQDVTGRCSWNSKNYSIALIKDGLIDGIATGTTTLETSIGSVKTTVRITVSPICTGIAADKDNLSVEVGSSTNVKLTATYENGKTEIITSKAQWSSSDSSIVTADKGRITGKAKGNAVITALYSGKKITILVKVSPILTKIEAESAKIDAEAGDTIPAVKITAYYTGADSVDITDKCAWISSSARIASVSTDGTIIAKGRGTAVITASHTVGNKTKRVSIRVTVTPKIVSLTIDGNPENLYAGKTARVRAVLNYNDGSTSIVSTKVAWESSDTNVATVQNGIIKGIGKGNVTITAVYNKDYTKSFNISVTSVLMSIKANVSTINLSLGNTSECVVTAVYQGDTPKDVTTECVWISSNAKVVTVENGVISPIAKGYATITATYYNKKTNIRVAIIS